MSDEQAPTSNHPSSTRPGGVPALADGDVERLRNALARIRYTVDSVVELLGQRASDALNRNVTVPGRLALTGDSPLETVTRLWRLQSEVPVDALERALPVEPLVSGGIVSVHEGRARALVDIRPYADDAGDWWVAADLTPGMDGRIGPIPPDHVLGLNAASSTLAQITLRTPAERALDLGTGCGVQALHLARHCDVVVATDVNHRALAMASLTARLNGVDVDLRHGDLFAPVAGERFDLIATNPPFVVSPGGSYVYRDSGLEGDEMTRRVVVDGASMLNDGGVLQSLGNWMHVRGQDWRERLGGWVDATGCDAWVIQRDVQDSAEYVELWLRDSAETGGVQYERRYEEWLSWFDDNDVEGIGFGWIAMRRSGSQDPAVRFEDWPHPVEQPFAPVVEQWFARASALEVDDETLLGIRWTVADDVRLEQVGQPGEADAEHLILRQQRGMRRAVTSDTAEAGFVGACDGQLPAGAVLDAVATVVGADPAALRQQLVPRIRQLVQDGFLVPPTEVRSS